MMEKTNISASGRPWGCGNDALGKALRTFPQSLEIAPRFPHSPSLGGCYTLSEFQLRKELSHTAFPNPSGSFFDWKRLPSTSGASGACSI